MCRFDDAPNLLRLGNRLGEVGQPKPLVGAALPNLPTCPTARLHVRMCGRVWAHVRERPRLRTRACVGKSGWVGWEVGL